MPHFVAPRGEDEREYILPIRSHDQLHQVALSAIEKLRRLPERITVLFLAANPLDQQQLRLDEEVRSVGEMIRKSEHLDSVRLESRWAVRPLDLLQAINGCQPRVAHSGGHGSNRDGIVFQDNSGQTKLVSKEAIVQTMAAASGGIQLVFFNTCFSRGQAEAAVEHIPAAIGMSASTGDDAARVFSSQFYSAIGNGWLCIRRAHNAKHHPPRAQLNKHSSCRMRAALFEVRCMPLLGGVPCGPSYFAKGIRRSIMHIYLRIPHCTGSHSRPILL